MVDFDLYPVSFEIQDIKPALVLIVDDENLSHFTMNASICYYNKEQATKIALHSSVKEASPFWSIDVWDMFDFIIKQASQGNKEAIAIIGRR